MVIIPAYNEAESIEAVVEELRGIPELDYLVVTDGSLDGTPDICAGRGYHFLRLPVNLGLAGCFQAGMKYAHRKGYRYAVQFDGDGQHRPEFILPMREKMREGYDIVLGSRFCKHTAQKNERIPAFASPAGKEEHTALSEASSGAQKQQENQMNALRSLGSVLIRMAIRLTTGAVVTDPTCGLRMYDRRMIEDFAEHLNYAPEPDTVSFLIKNGAKAAEVPVLVRERECGQSYLRPWNAAKYMLKMLTSILIVQNFRA